ncbi:MAG TPA: phosphotransferase, partial [Xanthobacteraceae bacterium]|nr:phosphotransferase [Xanthobacteraceae bacterium]
GAAVMVEWPERAAAFIQADRLDVSLSVSADLPPEARRVHLTGFGEWAERLARFRAVRELIDGAGFGGADRKPIQGDASGRSYERLFLNPGTAILMNSPPRPDGPPIKDGKPYSAIAHLAENVRPFVALSRALRERGFSAPEIYAADIENGFLVIEDLGEDGVITHAEPPAPIEHLYASAIDTLIALHTLELPAKLPVSPRIEHVLPSYDLDAFLVEAELLLDWYLPYRGAAPLSRPMRDYFASLWRAALGDIAAGPKTWVLRDYHSPNLLWLPAREGVAQVGLLDFQDAVMGPAAYDVASLLTDARVDVPSEMALTLLSRYVVGRVAADPNFSPDEFARHYVALSAQRATKILGIFARLAKRDGKKQYLAHLPRVWGYLSRALAHPSLAKLNSWYQAHVPPPTSERSEAEQSVPVP